MTGLWSELQKQHQQSLSSRTTDRTWMSLGLIAGDISPDSSYKGGLAAGPLNGAAVIIDFSMAFPGIIKSSLVFMSRFPPSSLTGSRKVKFISSPIK